MLAATVQTSQNLSVLLKHNSQNTEYISKINKKTKNDNGSKNTLYTFCYTYTKTVYFLFLLQPISRAHTPSLIKTFFRDAQYH